MPLSGIKLERFSALMNGVFVGVGVIFLIWGATDIAFPITERVNVAVFGLTRIILGIIALSVGIGIEAVQWAKIGNESSTKEASEDTPAQHTPAQQTSAQQPTAEITQTTSQ